MSVHAFLEGGASESINATTDMEEQTEVDLLQFLAFGSEFWWVTRLWQLHEEACPLLWVADTF